MLAPLLQPDLSPAYLGALAGPVGETLALTLAAMAIALPGGIAIGLIAVLGGRSGRILASFLTIFRAIPELTLAILCVIFFGLGTGAALVALSAYYMASTGKVFTDLLAAAPKRPLASLRQTGAGRTTLALYGLLPLTASQLLAYGSFAFECALRAAVVIGAVGGGGIGGELIGSLASFDLHRASTCILVTVFMIVTLDHAARWICAHPKFLWPLMVLGLGLALSFTPTLISWDHAVGVLADMTPPSLTGEQWLTVPALLLETLGIALGATLGAALIALPLAFGGAYISAPIWLRGVLRICAAGLRAIPEIIWGLVLLLWIGMGPLAGGAALFLHSLGSFVRLFADALDAAPSAPRIALRRTGASNGTAALFGALPQAAAAITAHGLFRFEWNLRMATVLGLIGAGGIGQALYEAQQLMFYHQLLAWLLITATLLLSAEWMTGRLRRRLGAPRPTSHAAH